MLKKRKDEIRIEIEFLFDYGIFDNSLLSPQFILFLDSAIHQAGTSLAELCDYIFYKEGKLMVVIGMYISEWILLFMCFESYQFSLISSFSPEGAGKKNEVSFVFIKE